MPDLTHVGERARVLIVDDEPLNVDLLEQELEILDCATLAATNGHEALEILATAPVDLVLLDIMMPHLDGFEVLRRIKSDPALRHLPVIMISALDQLESVVRCIELGAEDFLPKPFEPVLLQARIQASLEKKRWHDREARYMADIERERKRADQLLHVILPASAVLELKRAGRVAPRRYENVAVLFADIVDFTSYCERCGPEEVVANLDQLAEAWESLIGRYGLEKVKNIGDGIVATGNLLQPLDDPVMTCLRCAFAVAEAARANPARWQIRAGIHIGPVVAGIIGRSKFGFDIWGDTVNVAARLSEVGAQSGIHLSARAWAHVRGRCEALALGPVALKGRGAVEVYRCAACG